jgi:hypothetical protein
MSELRRRRVERIMDPSFISSLPDKSTEELRDMRDECREVENELSFERRLCQARTDILTAELKRRRGEPSRDDEDLVSRLSRILATERSGEEVRIPSRAPNFSIPRNADVPRRRVEEIVGEQTLARLPTIQTEEIQGIIASLEEHERNLSSRRKRVHDVLDAIQSEIVRRYRSGEADPPAALG